MTPSAVQPDLLTAEQYDRLPHEDILTELVQGRVVPIDFPKLGHGIVCATSGYFVERWIRMTHFGRATVRAGFITTRDPDSVRAPDLSVYSYDRLPRGADLSVYDETAPELVIEVRDAGEPWSDLLVRTAEFLRASVDIVIILNPAARHAHVYQPDDEPRIFTDDQPLDLPEPFDTFRPATSDFYRDI